MKEKARIGFFLLLFLFSLLTGVLAVNKAFTRKAYWDPAEGAAIGDGWINKYLPNRQELLLPYRIWNAAVNKRYYPEMNAYLAPDGQFLFGSKEPNSDLPVDQVTQLALYCKSHGMNFLYVICPGKPGADRELTELGISCYRNQTADRMKEALDEQKIPVLDLRSVFHSKEDYYSFFYKTEHHWTADAGIEAARELVTWLNTEYGMHLAVDRLAEEKIDRQVYMGIFVGEQGSKALGKFGERDDFIVRYPLYEPHLRYICPEDKVDEKGGFNVLVNDDTLSDDHLNGGRSLYYYYLFKNSGFVEIWDDDIPKGDIFLIKDSFSNVMTPFLALTANHITTWDMRNDNHIYAYLDLHPEIDTVIISYSSSFISTKSMNNFQ